MLNTGQDRNGNWKLREDILKSDEISRETMSRFGKKVAEDGKTSREHWAWNWKSRETILKSYWMWNKDDEISRETKSDLKIKVSRIGKVPDEHRMKS